MKQWHSEWIEIQILMNEFKIVILSIKEIEKPQVWWWQKLWIAVCWNV